MRIAFKKRRLRSRATHPAIAETELARLLILSLPASHSNHPRNGT